MHSKRTRALERPYFPTERRLVLRPDALQQGAGKKVQRGDVRKVAAAAEPPKS
jgi:hypothetical protein